MAKTDYQEEYKRKLKEAQEALELANHVHNIALEDLRAVARDKSVPNDEYYRRLGVVRDALSRVQRRQEQLDAVLGQSRLSFVPRKKKDSA